MRKRKLDPKIIRVGDKVKIINPEFFDGCMYDNNILDKTGEVIEKHGAEIRQFIDELLGVEGNLASMFIKERYFFKDPAVRRVAKGVAYDLVRRDMKAGNEKRIATRLVKEYKDDVVVVYGIKYVHTGKYEPMYYSRSSYDGEVDYAPAYLYDLKVHKILSVNYPNDVWQKDDCIWIEAKNVEKVML